MHCGGAGGLDDRLDVFCLTEYLADKPSCFENLARVLARLVVAVRLFPLAPRPEPRASDTQPSP